MKDYRSNYDVERLKRVLDSTEQPLGDNLAGPLPSPARRGRPPSTASSRTAQLRKRALSAVVVVTVAATIVVGPHFLRTSPTTNDATDPANGVTSPGRAAASPLDPFIDPCPATPERLEELQLPVGVLARGAEAVRLCPVATSAPQPPLAVPSDAIVTDVDGFVDQIDAWPVEAPPRPCPAGSSSGLPFTLTVSYPDGHSAQLFGADSACSGVKTGTDTISASWLLDEFRDRLKAQRAALADGS